MVMLLPGLIIMKAIVFIKSLFVAKLTAGTAAAAAGTAGAGGAAIGTIKVQGAILWVKTATGWVKVSTIAGPPVPFV